MKKNLDGEPGQSRFTPHISEFNVPNGIGAKHPAATMHTGKQWTKEEMWEAMARGPHRSALSPGAISHFKEEAAKKVRTNQARLMLWDGINDNPPKELNPQLLRSHTN